MTGIEMLREYAKCRLSEDTCGWVPNMLDKECDDFGSCSECHLVVCNAIADQIEREIDEAVADEVAGTLSAYEMNADARWYSAVEEGAESDCKAEYELISRYWLPRPRFEDGEPVQLGDEYDFCGETFSVEEIGYTWLRGDVCWQVKAMCGPIWFSMDGPLKRPEPPDTWEKLAAEVEACDGSACRYFGRNEEEGGAQCCGCKAHNVKTSCTMQVMRDIVRRTKKLAGVEE